MKIIEVYETRQANVKVGSQLSVDIVVSRRFHWHNREQEVLYLFTNIRETGYVTVTRKGANARFR